MRREAVGSAPRCEGVGYATQPTVTKLAEDRAERLSRDPDKAAKELDDRLRADLRKTGDFSRIHPLPRSGVDVPDDLDARLVVLPAELSYTKESGNAAGTAARAILKSRGNTPRVYRNTLVFLAADKVRLQDLDEAVRRFPAWKSILEEKKALNLDPHQEQQAENQEAGRGRRGDGAIARDLPVAAGPGAGKPAGGDHLAGDQVVLRRRVGRAREQKAPERRIARDLARLNDPA